MKKEYSLKYMEKECKKIDRYVAVGGTIMGLFCFGLIIRILFFGG